MRMVTMWTIIFKENMDIVSNTPEAIHSFYQPTAQKSGNMLFRLGIKNIIA